MKGERKIEDNIYGLTSEEVKRLTNEGYGNVSVSPPSKTVGQIWWSNLFTFYNMLNLFLAICVLTTGSYRNMLFLGVVLANFFIGTVQELRAKKTIDSLSLQNAPRITAIREGKETVLQSEELVLGDVVMLTPGGAVPADAVIISGKAEFSEALITGESEAVTKGVGDELYSGCFTVSGKCFARLIRVGKDSFTAKLTLEAKKEKKEKSVLKALMVNIIKFVTVFIVPVGLILFYNGYVLQKSGYEETMISTVAAVLGMIPDGLYLLTSLAFAVGIIKLAGKGALVQQLYSMESLARADVLCLDKTGTITTGSMTFKKLIPLEDEEKVKRAIGEFFYACPADNATGKAIEKAFPIKGEWEKTGDTPFSSERKYSAVSFSQKGTFLLGAPEILLGESANSFSKIISQHTAMGERVLSFIHEGEDKTKTPLAFIVIEDEIRQNAKETFSYFKKQGVAIKIISGDNDKAVLAIAKKAGVSEDAKSVDARGLTDEELRKIAEDTTVFGRVSPNQKRVLIKALQNAGHTVAMTGDGVNDVLALKDANCSIAMGNGADAARHVSQLVLLSSDFATMPQVVLEGRRVINNIERAASLFLVKTVYSFLLSTIFIFLPFSFPFVPIHLTLIGALTIGLPGFVLALEPNDKRVKGSFIKTVLKRVVPGALTVVSGVLLSTVVGSTLGLTETECSTIAVVFTGISGLMLLTGACLPLNKIRTALIITMLGAFILAIILLPDLFMLAPLSIKGMGFLLTLLPLSAIQLVIRIVAEKRTAKANP